MGAYGISLCYSVWILCPWTKLATCPWMAWGGELQLSIKLKLILGCMNRQLHWICSTGFQLLGLLRYHSFDRKTICWSISNTRVLVNKALCNFWRGGRFSRTLCRVFLASVVMWALAKQTCWSLRKSVMLLSLDFMPLDQIDHMSLNGLKRWVETRDKTQTET